MKKIISILSASAVLFSSVSFSTLMQNHISAVTAEETDVFYDDFSSGTLDADKWLVAKKNWGGKVTEDGVKVDYNGGVIPQNVSLKDGKLILTGNGNLYEGDLKGINKNGSQRDNGKRTGAAIATKEYYASGSYEVMAKVAPELGACSAIWTFEYEEDWDTGDITNHEIDIEMPGRPASEKKNQSYQYALCNTWIGENEGEYKTGYTDIGTNQADGKFHKYRFDWHTGDENEEARVEFHFDDVLTYVSKDYIPTNAGRLWLGLWFPNGWAGTPDFDIASFEIDYVKITPFHESGDTEQNETYPDDGWGSIEDISTSEPSVKCDVNADGKFDVADVVTLQKWLLGVSDAKLADWKAGDLYEDEKLNVLDLCKMKQELLSTESQTNKVHVTNTEELKAALENAKAGNEILLAEGEYVYSGATPKGYMFTSAADGTEENPIIIRSEDSEHPATLSGSSTNSKIVLAIQGDWWEIKDLKITNAQKGIMLDNSNYTKIIGCEVYNIGSEGIHFRDDSSNCLAEDCFVHDTGVVSPGYGEAIYVGSAKSTTGYGHECHYNTIRNCKLGLNVAAEHVDIKEYTIGTIVEGCTFDGTGMSGENSAKSFVNVKGNDCIIRNNIGYRNGCTAIQRAFEQNNVVDGWGQNASVYGNQVYMDTAINALGKKMYFLNAWDCSATVWNNFMAYDGELFSVDNEDDHWNYYNCNLLTYGT
ncbi:family 16 glycosylhydrolase [Ruminococcus callidus]|uniref:family 16 glycosylhydrolase n=1 Tax=Ruminococcus callidus TaxID=40519 RepID=UPI0030B8D1C7